MTEISIAQILEEFGAPSGLSFADMVRFMADQDPDLLAVEFGDEVVTYAEFVRKVAGAAAHLESVGIARGDRVAYLFPGNPYALYTLLGVTLIGGVLVPVNHESKGEMLRDQLDRYAVSAVVADPVSVDAVRDVQSGVPSLRQIVVGRESDYSAAIDRGADVAMFLQRDYPVPSDPALILSTSGTTGHPKGVQQASAWVGGGYITSRKWGFQDPPKSYLTLSWGYAAVIWQLSMTFFNRGSVVIAPRFSASKMWDDFHRRGCTHVHLMGTMHRMLLNQPPRPDDALRPPAVVTSAGMPADIWADFEKRFNVRVYEIYTSVDSGGCWMGNPGTSPAGSVGRPWIEYEAKLVDDAGEEVEVGEVGELLMRPTAAAPVVNYLDDPEAAAEKVAGGWVHLGDNFRRDEDGNYWFVDRKRDLIRRRAMGIAPASIERILRAMPGIAEIAVIGVPAELQEDEIKVVVVPAESSAAGVSAEGVVEFARKSLPGYMVPRYVEIVEKLPTTFGSEKVQKYVLRENWRTEKTWDSVDNAYLAGRSD